MRDPHYLRLRPGRSRHPFRAKNGETENRHITAARNDLPGIAAHTAAGARKEPVILYQVPASNCVREFLWRGPLALAPRRRSKNRTAKQFGVASAWPGPANYLTSPLAPASSTFFLIEAASSLLTLSLTVFGAPSTRSLASLRPRLVTSRTALMTLILLPPTSVSTTENSVFSSAGAAPPAAAPPPAATTVAAAAETPKVSSIFFTRSDASSSVSPLISSRIVSTFAMTLSSPLNSRN